MSKLLKTNDKLLLLLWKAYVEWVSRQISIVLTHTASKFEYREAKERIGKAARTSS